MDLLLGLIPAGIFIVELEILALLFLNEHMTPWKRYVNDTILM